MVHLQIKPQYSMKDITDQNNSRRNFIKGSAILGAGLLATPMTTLAATTTKKEEGLYMIGPREGYSPRVGTLLSTMTMMRAWIIDNVKSLSVEELDFQLDDKSNSIGAMLFHLAATERYYQLNTFEGIEWDGWNDEIKAEWDLAMNLGEKAREEIKGNDIEFYLEKLSSVRKATEKGFAERDDEWLIASETFFGNQPTNNHCKWFHVCEHESNHNGQIKFIKKRIKL